MPLSQLAVALIAALLACLADAGSRIPPAPPLAAPAASIVARVAGGAVEVVEYYNAGLDHYFITADPPEIAFLDGGAFGGAWKRTGNTFPAWDINGAPGDTVGVCRFAGTDRYRANGSRIGPNSHFYTADPAECAFVRTAWQSVANDGRSYPAWSFESFGFAVKAPVGGACPAGTGSLFRAYNNGARGDPNHRYSQQASQLQAMTGWAFEGLVMCLIPAQGVVLPATLGACSSANCAAAEQLGSGVGLVSLLVTVTNTTASPAQLVIPAGQTFVAQNVKFQDGLAAERLQAIVPAGTQRTFAINLFCLQATRDAAEGGVAYAPGPQTANPHLQDIVSLADGKLGRAADPQSLKASAVQFLVWEVTDGRGSLTSAQRALLVSLLATPAADLLTQADLLEKIIDTLSNPPAG